MPTVALIATNELPEHHKPVTLLTLNGFGFAPHSHVNFRIESDQGTAVAAGGASVAADGRFHWNSSTFPQLDCDSSLMATVTDQSGIQLMTRSPVHCV